MPSTPSPRWLDDGERATWLALVSVLVHLPAELDRQLQRDAGLTHFEYQVLASLSEAPERTLRMSTLAGRCEASLPRLSQVVTRLEGRGWAERSADPTDRRYTLARLTDDGWAEVVAAAPGHVDAVRRLVFDPLTATQQRQLRRITTRLAGALAPDGTWTGAGDGR